MAVTGVLAALLGAAALVVGAGAAHAGWPCNDQAPPQDTTVTVNNSTYVGVDTAPNVGAPPGDNPHAWVCVAPTGGEGNQSWANVWLTPTAGPGYTVTSDLCTVSPLPPGCGALVGPTGAEPGTPVATPNAPGGSTGGTGGEVGTASTTCVYVDGLVVCRPSFTVLGLTVADGDLPTVTPTNSSSPPACTGINNTCPGATVRAFGDPGTPTAEIDLGTTGTTVDVITTPQCVQVNSVC